MWKCNLKHFTAKKLKAIRTDLLIGNEVVGSSSEKKRKTAFYAYGEIDGELVVPRFYPLGASVVQNLTQYATITVETPHEMHASTRFVNCDLYTQPPQQQVKELLLTFFRQRNVQGVSGATVYLRQGFGRMATLLFLAFELHTKTLIITHNKQKYDKWINAISQFFPDSPHIDNDIKITTAKECLDLEQKCKMRDTFASTGFVILDDINSFDLSFFAKFLNLWSVSALLGVGLSGRMDNRHKLIEWSVGGVLYDSDHVWSEVENIKSNQEIVGHYISDTYHISKHQLAKDFNEMSLNPETFLQLIRDELYMSPKVHDVAVNSQTKANFHAYTEDPHYINVPRGYGIEKMGMPSPANVLVSKGVRMSEGVEFTGTLKSNEPPQLQGHDIAMKIMTSSPCTGTILCYYCGGGKTVVAIAIAVSNGTRTLVLVNNEDLLSQWLLRISTFAPNASTGRIQQDCCEVEGKDIVVGMIQSIASRNYPEYLMKTFGLCIVDECHRIGCRYFSGALQKITAAHILGLSATPYRKDGMDPLLHWCCGPIRMAVERPFVEVKVVMMSYHPNIPERLLRIRRRGAVVTEYNRSKMLNDLSECTSRNQFILETLKKQIVDGRKTILLSERLATIKWLKEQLTLDETVCESDFGEHTGKVKQGERDEALTKKLILATYQKAKEGLDVPQLDTLVLATPVSDIVQSTGRILRELPEKKMPLVIDIWDDIDPFVGSGYVRRRYYKKHNFTIEDV